MVGLEGFGHAEPQGLGDERPARRVVPIDEGDGRARVAGATRAPDAVDVDLLVLGALVVDDVRDVVDVEAIIDDVVMMRGGRLLLKGNVDDLREERGASLDRIVRQEYR